MEKAIFCKMLWECEGTGSRMVRSNSERYAQFNIFNTANVQAMIFPRDQYRLDFIFEVVSVKVESKNVHVWLELSFNISC